MFISCFKLQIFIGIFGLVEVLRQIDALPNDIGVVFKNDLFRVENFYRASYMFAMLCKSDMTRPFETTYFDKFHLMQKTMDKLFANKYTIRVYEYCKRKKHLMRTLDTQPSHKNVISLFLQISENKNTDDYQTIFQYKYFGILKKQDTKKYLEFADNHWLMDSSRKSASFFS